RREFSETLPWQHLKTGVDEEFLRAELAKSLTEDYTPDCRVYGCQKCGACDFKEVMPVVQCKLKSSDESAEKEESIKIVADVTQETFVSHSTTVKKEAEQVVVHHWYRLSYAKQGDVRLLSHLELMQVFFQAFRRAGVKLHHTQGFNPGPKVSFSPALPVGTESLAEYMDIDLVEVISDEAQLLHNINAQLPTGLTIQSIADVPVKKGSAAMKNRTCYQIRFDQDLSGEDREKLENFMNSESLTISKLRKGKKHVMDVRKQVESLVESGNDSLEMVLISEEGKAASKPVEILKAILNLTDEQSLDMGILKVWNKSVQ
ncbi:MAG: TIGR03936 family radical SAM-associated protein, partial [Desulfobacterales bacterium]|nr:TIGR03936 family radical SAM-associated protein [Desulfobacterales bacterium]